MTKIIFFAAILAPLISFSQMERKDIEDQVFNEINEARKDPLAFMDRKGWNIKTGSFKGWENFILGRQLKRSKYLDSLADLRNLDQIKSGWITHFHHEGKNPIVHLGTAHQECVGVDNYIRDIVEGYINSNGHRGILLGLLDDDGWDNDSYWIGVSAMEFNGQYWTVLVFYANEKHRTISL